MGFELKNTQLEADGEFVSFAGTDDVICSVASGSYENDDKLAMLFAAAPELLSELIRLRNIVASYRQDSGDNLDIVDAVIAKATGTKG
ncbi:hypothetical protein [Providencia alcalifaciens]|uniref:hypothetical protein n=1 Tax=Providencia alcalifaciens TaxID=126385 RepID=UPI0012B5335A|nr:hypothetical protein [Providencia alcalifaciens]MTC25163.1 hypothetical protein [Providencia alcalifaciens]MTC64173.1 hypothetical protein [Providencia alcalifaciens]